jgi:uncharacterized membrane protein (DUF441 family)
MNSDLLLVLLIVIGLLGRSPLISTAASLLLILKLIHLDRFFPVVERRGLEFGLLCLTIAVLVPFAAGKIPYKDFISIFTSVPGILALLGGTIAAHINGKGLDLLQVEPHIVIGLVVGSMIGILFFRGIPIGPLMAAGITSFLYQIFRIWWN